MTVSRVPIQEDGAETVLVTGANGFVGLNLVAQLARRDIPVLAASRRPPDALGAIAGTTQVEWVLCDVTERDRLIELVQTRGVTRVVHAAAVTPTPDMEQQDPARVVDVNLGGTLNALEAARRGQVRRFVFISSSVLYRGFPLARGAAREEDAGPPINLYGLCKDACERLCQQYRRLCGLSTTSVRLGTAYGPWERASHSRTRLSAIAQLVARIPEVAGRPLRVHGLDVVRDYIHVADACAALADLTLHPQPRWDLYNLSSDVGYPLVAVLEALQICIPGFHWQPAKDPEAADFSFTAPDTRAPLDLSRLRADLPHFQPGALRTGIADYVAWYQGAYA